MALPWCYSTWTETITTANATGTYTRHRAQSCWRTRWWPAFAVFLCWWGVRLVSRALVNLGIVGFAVAVAWFYFSDILSKLGRSLGLIGLGMLFLAGGWALEKMRRRMLARVEPAKPEARQAAVRNATADGNGGDL